MHHFRGRRGLKWTEASQFTSCRHVPVDLFLTGKRTQKKFKRRLVAPARIQRQPAASVTTVNICRSRADVNLRKETALSSFVFWRSIVWHDVSHSPGTGYPRQLVSFKRCARRFRNYGARCPNFGEKQAIGKAGTPMQSNESRTATGTRSSPRGNSPTEGGSVRPEV